MLVLFLEAGSGTSWATFVKVRYAPVTNYVSVFDAELCLELKCDLQQRYIYLFFLYGGS
jgi:hypothetical protein